MVDQIISYAYVMKANSAGIIYPSIRNEDAKLKPIGILDGYWANIFKYGFTIPQNVESYDEFVDQMKLVENELNMSNVLHL
ncbi:hypothetical protein [Periweissella fabalis]|uniref:Uncharacterized protein n=1 Tax=Periweissella fabalis TaxID=1070421 RepID=A0A7X6N1J0_9LACO|nr:hypothetical protein [Periweissella fabalis]MCM0599265.1 hypothetical protein [Periweissella fabalis]NKZ23544.1 hypothetical protein [Periweissella fabalis]